jgi:hypothetical protein
VSASWSIIGVQELRDALRKLPDALAAEGRGIVIGAANHAALKIRSGYGAHRRTGNLQEHVVIKESNHDAYGSAIKVSSTARHAWIFEFQENERHTNIKGANRGRMWSHQTRPNIFVPAVVSARLQMVRELVELVRRNGVTVSGDGG